MTTIDERVERATEAAHFHLAGLTYDSRKRAENIARSVLGADDSASAASELKALRSLERALQENEWLLRMISSMENEDPELVERWRANTKDKPHDK
ncbi:hypothetical protein LCGC14_0355540 [marine sediment metagenome]|uniref:Uncharacterized protein n=1 Tax=marine sediment metagenome TaxID=412755 RepID=A0A0F9TFE0_9ZZZZ